MRTEAGRLRARLREYYADEGTDDSLVIELPKGGYVPVLRRAPIESKGRPRVWLTLALAGFIVALGVVAWWLVQRSTRPIGIAVLPFENLNHDTPPTITWQTDLPMS